MAWVIITHVLRQFIRRLLCDISKAALFDFVV